MRNEIKSKIGFIVKLIIYSTVFFIIIQLLDKFYINLVKEGIVFLYLKLKNLSRLDVPLTIYLKLQPTAVFFGLMFATPNINFWKRLKFICLGAFVFYFFDVIFATSQVLLLNQLLAIEYFIRSTSVILIWVIFSYSDFLTKKFN
jgi:hypothetical protein